MLKSRKPEPIGLFIPKDTQQQGDLDIEGRIRLEGRFTGNISTDSTLEVSPSGSFSGSCTAQMVEVHGDCEGQFIVSDRFTLRRGGKFSGLLDTARISIEDGCSFFGELRVKGHP